MDAHDVGYIQYIHIGLVLSSKCWEEVEFVLIEQQCQHMFSAKPSTVASSPLAALM